MEEPTLHTVKAKDAQRAKIASDVEEFLKKNKIEVVDKAYCPKEHKADFTNSGKQNKKRVENEGN